MHYYKINNEIMQYSTFGNDIALIMLVMFRAWIFRALGGLGLLCIGPQAGRAFLYRVSSFFRAFLKYKMYPHFCLMSMKYKIFLLSFLKLSIGYKFGPRKPKIGGFWADSLL